MARINTHGKQHKLGKRIATISRTVGPTCPASCPFLNNGCYAQITENRRPSVKENWSRWQESIPDSEVERLGRLHRKGKIKAMRLHIGGDFLSYGELDRRYIAWLLRLKRRLPTLPIWTYTHAWKTLAPHKKYFDRLGIVVFASVHSLTEARNAKILGYRVALISKVHKKHWDRSIKSLPINGEPAIVCPEQLGTKPDCERCGYCFKPHLKHDLILLDHTIGKVKGKWTT